jgi:hypothetical protein
VTIRGTCQAVGACILAFSAECLVAVEAYIRVFISSNGACTRRSTQSSIYAEGALI